MVDAVGEVHLHANSETRVKSELFLGGIAILWCESLPEVTEQDDARTPKVFPMHPVSQYRSLLAVRCG